MAHPKRRHSNCRTRLRRTHDTLKPPSLSKCLQCGASIRPHRVCPYCGYYKKQLVVSLTAEEEKKG